MNQQQFQINIEEEFVDKLTIHKNIGQELIVTTIDKLKLCLLDTRNSLTIKREWLTPLTLLVAIFTTIVAADFSDFILKSNVWSAIYIIGAILSFLWLCKSGFRAFKNRNEGSIERIIENLIKETNKRTT